MENAKIEPRRLLGALIVLIVLFLAYYWRRTEPHPRVLDIRSIAFSSIVYEVKVVSSDFTGDARNELVDAFKEELDGVDRLMSWHREDSAVARLNAAGAGQKLRVDPPLWELLKLAGEVHEQSGGAFDVTVGPLVELWGFKDKVNPGRVPSRGEREAIARKVGWEKVRLAKQRVSKEHAELAFDLSAIAKGYAVDRIAKVLEKKGYEDFMVEIGGEVKVSGHNLRGRPWRIGIETPDPERREVFAALSLEDTAVATSGDYRNAHTIAGRRYSHTIDPRTATPIANRVASVTVIHKSCAAADAWSTAMTVLGVDEGVRLADEKGLAVFFIAHDGRDGFVTRSSKEFGRYALDRAGPPTRSPEG